MGAESSTHAGCYNSNPLHHLRRSRASHQYRNSIATPHTPPPGNSASVPIYIPAPLPPPLDLPDPPPSYLPPPILTTLALQPQYPPPDEPALIAHPPTPVPDITPSPCAPNVLGSDSPVLSRSEDPWCAPGSGSFVISSQKKSFTPKHNARWKHKLYGLGPLGL